jgi:D-amino peptidase
VDVGAYAGALLIGYHAGASSLRGTLAHTISGEFLHEVRLNGVVMSEAGVSAAIAGHYGVPVLMIAGDDVAVEETQRLLGAMASATLKTSLGFLSALNPSPDEADQRLREGVRDAMTWIGRSRPFTVSAPITLELRLRTRFMAEWMSYLEAVRQIDAFTVSYEASNIVAVSRFLQFLTSARGALG